MEMINEAPTITPIDCPTLRPSAKSVDPAVHAELLAPFREVSDAEEIILEAQRLHVPVIIQYPAKPCHVQLLRSSGIGIMSRLQNLNRPNQLGNVPTTLSPSTYVCILIVGIFVNWTLQLRCPVEKFLFGDL
jgi:hypothetical protein